MKRFLRSFAKVIRQLKLDEVLPSETIEKLEIIHDGFGKTGKKLFSAAKFIDYFVHDILDYSMLNKESNNFVKDTKICRTDEAVQEIIDI